MRIAKDQHASRVADRRQAASVLAKCAAILPICCVVPMPSLSRRCAGKRMRSLRWIGGVDASMASRNAGQGSGPAYWSVRAVPGVWI